jgi:hypothetical protein
VISATLRFIGVIRIEAEFEELQKPSDQSEIPQRMTFTTRHGHQIKVENSQQELPPIALASVEPSPSEILQ